MANENRLLKALQKRQDSALRRYEGTTAELPKIINSHHEELRILQIKYKKLKALHKETCDILKEKENELHSLQTQNKHLLQLSKDRNLGEREKLQMQVSDLNNKVAQQQESIQLLQRKLALESKSLKHQLHVEVSKHKQTQKNLAEALEKVKDLEHLIDNKTRRQLLSNGKDKISGTQSLTNLRNYCNTTVNPTNKYKKYNETQKNNLPELNTSRLNDNIHNDTNNSIHSSQQTNLPCSETITSSRQNQKFNSQKRSQHIRSPLFDALIPKFKDTVSQINENMQNASFDENDIEDHQNLYRNMETRDKCTADENSYKIFKEQHDQFDHFSNYTDSENENDEEKSRDYHMMNAIQNSHDLYARMISSTDHELTLYTTDSQESEQNGQLFSKQITLHESYNKQFETLKQQDYDHSYEYEVHKKDSNGDGFSIEFKNDKFDKTYSDSCSEDFTINDVKVDDVDSKLLKAQVNSQVNLLQNEDNVKDPSIKNTLNALEYNMDHMYIHDEPNHLINNPDDLEIASKFENHHIYNDDKMKTSTTSQHDELESIKEYATILSESEKEIEHPQIDNCYLSSNNDNSSFADDIKNKFPQNNYAEQCLSTNSIAEKPKATLSAGKLEVTEDQINSVNTISQIDKRKRSLPNTYTPNHIGKSFSNAQENNHKAHMVNKSKSVNYNKEKLLATMKAIDNNEDVDFLIGQQFPKRNSLTRFQITENLFRGLPAHSKKNYDIIKDVFDNGNMDNKISLT